MNQTAVIDILKQAILLERRGRSFYRQAAESAGTPAVRQFFQTMADEESHHIQILSEQYQSYLQHQTFVPPPDSDAAVDQVATKVLSADIQHKIEAAGFEAAAVSAAMAMEKEAVTLYADRAAATADRASPGKPSRTCSSGRAAARCSCS